MNKDDIAALKWLGRQLDNLVLAIARRYPGILAWLQAIVTKAITEADRKIQEEQKP